jgi:radical SAM protein with 4Fe4S-binding SPASM domain
VIYNKAFVSEKIVDASGAFFLKPLKLYPRPIKEITVEIASSFMDGDFEIIKQDVQEFYSMLEQDGFLVSGVSAEEANSKKTSFSYKALKPMKQKDDFLQPIEDRSSHKISFLADSLKKNPRIVNFQIELTSRCNERCVHCYIPHANKLYDIEPSLFYNVLEQCRDMGVLFVNLSGGEPMMHPCFCDFVKKAKEFDFAIMILTNLTLLNDEIIDVLKSHPLVGVQVSLYSMDPAIHDAVTCLPGSFEKTYNNILKLIENDIPMTISCPLMRTNKDSYPEVIKWAYKHHIKTNTDLILMARYDHTTDNLVNRLDLEEVREILGNIIGIDLNYADRILKTDFDKTNIYDTSEDAVCGVGMSEICMVANGNVYPCPGWQNYIVGNLNEQSLLEIWNNSLKLQYLRKLRNKDFPPCKNCEFHSFCDMCMARNFNESPDNDIFAISDNVCKIAAINKELALKWKAAQ